ncbi:dienelactone hydrolase family protein [Candidatus Poribacteria bacterium]|jgi:carboxymethylenebutenolidase|nr:dienelactone hydrolase family protein [Candidatus Poribacteria bacterium]MBT5535998.1 dienelactone hydrolase family protein [Candidatus Poribacteria bacterium]MBT5711692.1 dienelactone hydrolase family protein [Candidatus Poribacteria bacterium]MBT7096676.1 dienelactone hydrolase family protein [Candidatus Poribacteria bacterium]MBT7804038.1 dienelactone hydrolase family protein [Candidatus Poribacteria bacterium]
MRVAVVVCMALGALATTAVAQDFALARLEDSPRHHEWVALEREGRTLHAFVVYPEVGGKADAVVVIHENRGLTDWVRSFADQVAEAGYLAIAPDMLSGDGPDGGKTSDFPSSDAAREGIYGLDPERVTGDLNAAADYVTGLPAASRKVSVAGFCWGGSQTFRFATNREGLTAACVFYGSAPKSADDIARISSPVYGFYGQNDNRINSTLDDTASMMTAAGKTFDPVIYDGAGHAFMRRGDAPDADDASRAARDGAFKRLIGILGDGG